MEKSIENVSNIHLHDTSDTEEHIQERLLEQYLDGEIDEAEYMSKMSQTDTKQKLKNDVTGAKAKKYQELQEQYIDGEITEEQMEEQMDRLFDSGDDFLEAEVSDGPDMTSEMAFRAKEIGQVVAFAIGVAAVAFLFFITKGAALLPMIGVAIVGLLAYARYKGAI